MFEDQIWLHLYRALDHPVFNETMTSYTNKLFLLLYAKKKLVGTVIILKYLRILSQFSFQSDKWTNEPWKCRVSVRDGVFVKHIGLYWILVLVYNCRMTDRLIAVLLNSSGTCAQKNIVLGILIVFINNNCSKLYPYFLLLVQLTYSWIKVKIRNWSSELDGFLNYILVQKEQ